MVKILTMGQIPLEFPGCHGHGQCLTPPLIRLKLNLIIFDRIELESDTGPFLEKYTVCPLPSNNKERLTTRRHLLIILFNRMILHRLDRSGQK